MHDTPFHLHPSVCVKTDSNFDCRRCVRQSRTNNTKNKQTRQKNAEYGKIHKKRENVSARTLFDVLKAQESFAA